MEGGRSTKRHKKIGIQREKVEDPRNAVNNEEAGAAGPAQKSTSLTKETTRRITRNKKENRKRKRFSGVEYGVKILILNSSSCKNTRPVGTFAL